MSNYQKIDRTLDKELEEMKKLAYARVKASSDDLVISFVI